MLLAGAMTLAAATAPGWRHRHAGGAAHTHSHSGVTHTHGGHTHSHSHEHGRDGWHVHLTFFGFELTLWEPGADELEIAVTESDRSPKPGPGEAGAGLVLLAGEPMTAGWVSLLLIDPGPVPVRVRVDDPAASRWSLPAAEGRFAHVADPPPLPPPEAALLRGVRRSA